MPRELKSAEQIRAEVHRLIHEGSEVQADKAQIGVPPPTPLAGGNTENGSNWTMSVFRGAVGYEDWIRLAVAQVQARWDLG